MKLQYLTLLFLLIICNSCSDDDESNQEQVLGKEIKKISTFFYSNIGELYLITEDFYNNDKILLTNRFDGNSEKIGKVDYLYDKKGLVSFINYYQANNLEEASIFQYDEKNRLISIQIQIPNNVDQGYIRNFEYSDNNTIVENQNHLNGDPVAAGMFTFYLDELGLIYKIISEEGEIFEGDYIGNNLISIKTPFNVTYRYTYDNINTTQGDFYNKLNKSTFGSNNNAALWKSSLIEMVEVYNDQFLLGQNWNNNSIDISYEFDSSGYPEVRIEKNGSIVIKRMEYFYK